MRFDFWSIHPVSCFIGLLKVHSAILACCSALAVPTCLRVVSVFLFAFTFLYVYVYELNGSFIVPAVVARTGSICSGSIAYSMHVYLLSRCEALRIRFFPQPVSHFYVVGTNFFLWTRRFSRNSRMGRMLSWLSSTKWQILTSVRFMQWNYTTISVRCMEVCRHAQK